MITLIPSLEVMKSVVDSNHGSDASTIRKKAFTKAMDLMTLADFRILMDGLVYSRIQPKLKQEHQDFFESLTNIDKSAVGLTGYQCIDSIKFIAKSEARERRVIILTENPTNYLNENSIMSIKPEDFLVRIERAIQLHQEKTFSTLDDALIAVFLPVTIS